VHSNVIQQMMDQCAQLKQEIDELENDRNKAQARTQELQKRVATVQQDTAAEVWHNFSLLCYH